MSCVEIAGAVVCGGGPMQELKREDLGERWCFVCRKRKPFVFLITAPIEPSYYEPNASVECDRGHYDGDLFPGRYREWVEG